MGLGRQSCCSLQHVGEPLQERTSKSSNTKPISRPEAITGELLMCGDEVKASEALQKMLYYNQIWTPSFIFGWGKLWLGSTARTAPEFRSSMELRGSRALPSAEQSQTCPQTSQASAWEPGGTKQEQDPVLQLAAAGAGLAEAGAPWGSWQLGMVHLRASRWRCC